MEREKEKKIFFLLYSIVKSNNLFSALIKRMCQHTNVVFKKAEIKKLKVRDSELIQELIIKFRYKTESLIQEDLEV